jgi:hypothetical protein
MISMADTMPELVLVAETEPAAARRARRLAGRGVLKRLYPSIYTSNVDSPPESVVLRHWHAIVGHLLPGGVIAPEQPHRRAARYARIENLDRQAGLSTGGRPSLRSSNTR